MKYKSEKEIIDMIERFETARIARDDWHHAEHLIVACRYAIDLEPAEAIDRMRSALFRLLVAFGVPTGTDSPYHETLTVFWLNAVRDFREANSELGFFDLCTAVTERFDKDYPLRFYSRERLNSDEARCSYVTPDLAGCP